MIPTWNDALVNMRLSGRDVIHFKMVIDSDEGAYNQYLFTRV